MDTALAANSPGLSPVASDLVYIGKRLSLGETSFSGTISIKTAEAQFGGFYIEIDQYAIPEPSMLGLLLLGFGLVAPTRRHLHAA